MVWLIFIGMGLLSLVELLVIVWLLDRLDVARATAARRTAAPPMFYGGGES